MKFNRTTDLIQIITGIAVIVGLLLVFYELRQAKSLTLADLISQGYGEVMDNARTIMGEDSADVLARACFEPTSLQPRDEIILEAYFSSQLAQVSRLEILELVADFGVPWQTLAPSILAPVLSTETGRDWFTRNVPADSEIRRIAEPMLQLAPNCNTMNQLSNPGVTVRPQASQ